jgi:hypothetical protein
LLNFFGKIRQIFDIKKLKKLKKIKILVGGEAEGEEQDVCVF